MESSLSAIIAGPAVVVVAQNVLFRSRFLVLQKVPLLAWETATDFVSSVISKKKTLNLKSTTDSSVSCVNQIKRLW